MRRTVPATNVTGVPDDTIDLLPDPIQISPSREGVAEAPGGSSSLLESVLEVSGTHARAVCRRVACVPEYLSLACSRRGVRGGVCRQLSPGQRARTHIGTAGNFGDHKPYGCNWR